MQNGLRLCSSRDAQGPAQTNQRDDRDALQVIVIGQHVHIVRAQELLCGKERVDVRAHVPVVGIVVGVARDESCAALAAHTMSEAWSSSEVVDDPVPQA